VSGHALPDLTEVGKVEPYLRSVGEMLRAVRDQDSGCVSYGVRLPDGDRWFVKEAVTGRARRSPVRAWAFHRAVRHPVIVPQLHWFGVRGGSGTAVVMPWHAGEVLAAAPIPTTPWPASAPGRSTGPPAPTPANASGAYGSWCGGEGR
jgi:serine/threonine-protein kinase